MYNPISLSVVRQSLKWMGVPLPIKSQSSKSTLVSHHGTIMNQVTLTFDRYSIHQCLFKHGMGEIIPRTDAIIDLLQSCFCDDIQVAETCYVPGTCTIRATLLCSLTARD